MCGLVGILENCPLPGGSEIPEPAELLEVVAAVEARNLERLIAGDFELEEYAGGEARLMGLAEHAQALKEYPHLLRMLRDQEHAEGVSLLARRLRKFVEREEQTLERAGALESETVEAVNAIRVRVQDVAWALEREILAKRDGVEALGGGKEVDSRPERVLRTQHRLQVLLDSIDRLEVRGRDSAGIALTLNCSDLSVLERLEEALLGAGYAEELVRRRRIVEGGDGAILWNPSKATPSVSFLYKVAAEIGEMGQNVRGLREKLSCDGLLRAALGADWSTSSLLAHTRWASNGIINIPNCHPLDGRTVGDQEEPSGVVLAVLNGDIDNYAELQEVFEIETGRRIAPSVTTDAKIIPVLMRAHLAEGLEPLEAFRKTVNRFEGSHAIALETDRAPGQVFLALRGSGQSIYIGLAHDRVVYASEVYGLVEETPRYVRMDGEALRDPGDAGSCGQIFRIDPSRGIDLDALEGFWFDGTPLVLGAEDVHTAQITTRDIDRKGFEHFFAKEIAEAPRSVAGTLRGKYEFHRSGNRRQVRFNLGEEVLPSRIVEALSGGQIRRIVCIGQGTAAVAGQACATLVGSHLTGAGIAVRGLKSSEFSGFALTADMSDQLVIAVTQSGTTTDTNRAIDLAVSRGAHTLAIVNRRGSDVTHKVDGVFYTSDGRDVEMSVASTKAFYSQVTAGAVLALRFAQILGTEGEREIAAGLQELGHLPEMLARIHEDHEPIAASARELAPTRRHWAVVGSGPNYIAAQEIRIKLSELCYKSIACDVIEDKKHIDLSSEPLILVCAAGSRESVLGDLVKDVAIFRAHKAEPVVIAGEGESRFDPYAAHVLPIPLASETLSLVLGTMVGHLWGYHAALAIDAEARPFSRIRAELVRRIWVEENEGSGLARLLGDRELRTFLESASRDFSRRKREGRFASSLEGETCANLALLFKYALGTAPLADFEIEFERPASYENVIDEFLGNLGRAIDDLSRPIDAIKHQAKTVTVGTSRPEGFAPGPLLDVLRELSVGVNEVGFRDVAALRVLQSAVREMAGFTLYRVDGLDAFGRPQESTTIRVERKGGLARKMNSRADDGIPLAGTKRTIVTRRQLHVGIGKSDQRRLAVLPLLDRRSHVARLLLLHLGFVDHLPLAEKQTLMGPKLEEVKNAVVESNVPWENRFLESLSPEFLLTRSVDRIAETIFAIEGASPTA